MMHTWICYGLLNFGKTLVGIRHVLRARFSECSAVVFLSWLRNLRTRSEGFQMGFATRIYGMFFFTQLPMTDP